VTVASRRTRPLTVDDIPEQLAVSASGTVALPHPDTVEPSAATGPEIHRARLAAGVQRVRTGIAALRLNERLLMVIGGVVAPVGLVLVALGWYGAARTPYVFEQVPYLISGGLLGVGLVFLGAFLYFAHWMTQVVKEQRAQTVAVVDAVRRLQEDVSGLATAAAATSGAAPGGPAPAGGLVATAHGSMAHRPDCVVVTGKEGLRIVGPGERLEACKLCEPELG
jgi:hypothetical protein